MFSPIREARPGRRAAAPWRPTPQSQTAPRNHAGPALAAPQPVPAPAPRPTAACAITTWAVDATLAGASRSRTKVGVNEQVAMDAHVPAQWTASGGTLGSQSDSGAIWTAPGTAPAAGIDCTVTATPASGSPCSVTMTVVPPSHRVLTKTRDRVYLDDRSGSGFEATAAILPHDVSFLRVEVREGAAEGLATGYYEKVLGWDKLPHQPGRWALADPSMVRIEDGIGTREPGRPMPFGPGLFEWRIPQLYRALGSSGDGEIYATAVHLQVMSGATGSETTDKEGLEGKRTPPGVPPGRARPDPPPGAPRPDFEP